MFWLKNAKFPIALSTDIPRIRSITKSHFSWAMNQYIYVTALASISIITFTYLPLEAFSAFVPGCPLKILVGENSPNL
jgi:hypothetical protein